MLAWYAQRQHTGDCVVGRQAGNLCGTTNHRSGEDWRAAPGELEPHTRPECKTLAQSPATTDFLH